MTAGSADGSCSRGPQSSGEYHRSSGSLSNNPAYPCSRRMIPVKQPDWTESGGQVAFFAKERIVDYRGIEERAL